jgi:hypothetical protein
VSQRGWERKWRPFSGALETLDVLNPWPWLRLVLARKLVVIMHAMWLDGTIYCGDPAATAADVRAHAAVKDSKLLGRYA